MQPSFLRQCNSRGAGETEEKTVKSQFLQSRAMYKLLQNHGSLYSWDLVYQQSS